MGQAKSLLAKIAPLGEEEVRQLAALYGFERHEMEALHRYFTVIAGSVEGTSDPFLFKKMFKVFLFFSRRRCD